MKFPRNALLVTGFAVCALSVPASAITPTPAAVGSATTKATPTPTMTVMPTGPVLIAIDNVSATDLVTFSTDFDRFPAGTVAEDLDIPGMNFTSDPPGIWQITPATATFEAGLHTRFQTLTGNVLQQSTSGTLTITFGSPVSAFSCNFAEDQPPGASSLVVQLYSGTTLVGSTSRLTTVGDVFGEGAVNIVSSTRFDKVRLSSMIGLPSPTPSATPHGPSVNPVRSPPSNPPEADLGLHGGDNGCSISSGDAQRPAALLGAGFFLIAFARYARRRAAADR